MKRFPKHFHLKNNQAGFTLIEMLVVLGIIVLISFIAMPSVSSYFQVSLNSATRDIGVNVKEASNAAMLTGRVYRIAYDLKENSFWVESGPTDLLLDTKETKIRDERRKRLLSSSSDKKEDQSQFSMDRSITRKKISLPRGITFEDIITQQAPDPIISGMAFTHFFPHGLAEQTIIHLIDQSKHQASLVITPLMGKLDFYARYIKPNEIFEK